MLTALWTRSDEHYVRRVLAGHRNDFEVLVRRYLPAVLAVGRGILGNATDADDLAQECFISAYQRLDTLREPAKFPSWLLAIARHAALNWRRRVSPEIPLNDQLAEVAFVEGVSPDRKEMREMLHKTLMDLDEETRELLLLHYFSGYSLRDIAGMYGITRMAAAKRLQRAREALGVEILKVMPEMPQQKALRGTAKKIAAAAIAAGVTWKMTPVHGMVLRLLIGTGKLAGVGIVSLAVLSGAFFAAPGLLGWNPSFPAVKAAPVHENVADASTAARNDAASVITPVTPEPQRYSLSNVLVTPLDQAIPNAEVKAERITWNPQELPPAETEVHTARADANGAFTLEGLPPGAYSVTATTTVLGGAHDFRILEDGHVQGPRNIKMYPILRSYGLLVDGAGTPVEGAAIYPISHELFPNQEFDHVTVCGIRACSDAKGRFMFTGIIPGSWKLYVVAPGHQPFYTDYVPCYGLRSTVVIEDPGAMRGHIVDAAGNPAPNLKGTAFSGQRTYTYDNYQSSYRMQNTFSTNAEGTFEIASLPPGDYSFSLDDSALVLTHPNQKLSVFSGQTADVSLEVTTGGTLYGRVLNKKTREGIPDLGISLYLHSGETSVDKKVKTGGSGDYYFTGLPAGAYSMYIDGGDSYPNAYRERPEISVTLGETIEDKDILLDPALMVAGLVVDASGAPVASAAVKAQGPGQYATATAKAAGEFSLALAETGTVVITAANGALKSAPVRFDCTKPMEKELVLRLDIPAGGGIEGVVRDAHGKPVYNAMVSAFLDNGEHDGPIYSEGDDTRSNPAGEFKIEGLIAGHYRLSANLQMGRTIGAATADVAKNTVTRNVVIAEQAAGTLTIEGTIHYPNGLPCPLAALGLENQQMAQAGALGRFTFTGLAEGNYTIYALSPGYSPLVAPGIAAGTKDVQLTLENYSVLSGTVVDAKTGAPVTDFSVHYRMQYYAPFDTNGVESGSGRFSSTDGAFRMEKVPMSPLSVQVGAEGYAPWSTTLAAPENGEEYTIAAELSSAAQITGTVRDTSGKPIAAAAIQAGTSRTTADDAGTFTLEGLAAGEEVSLIAEANGYARTTVVVTPGAGEALDIVLSQGGSLRIRASSEGQPLLQFNVTIRSLVGNGNALTAQFVTAIEGEAVAQHVAPGDVEIILMMPVNGQPSRFSSAATVHAVVEEGQETQVEIAAEPAPATPEEPVTPEAGNGSEG